MKKRFRYIYGPVPSWRLGSSLGIDLLSQKEKICSYDCLYCQLGRSKDISATRQFWVTEDAILQELEMVSPNISIDYITFSGRGEPTLASNLGSTITAVKRLRHEPVAVITNSSLMGRQDVRDELSQANFVIAKLDASSQESFILINRPFQDVRFDQMVNGIKSFRRYFRGKFALQIMFMKENLCFAKDMAEMAKEINPDEVQINTPLRPCGVEPLDREVLSEIQDHFQGLTSISVYEGQKKIVLPISDEDTLKRRGKVTKGREGKKVG